MTTIDLATLARHALKDRTLPEATWSAYEAGAADAWGACDDALVLTILALRGGAWEGLAAAFGTYAREVEARLRAQLASEADGVQASLVDIHYRLDLLERALLAHDEETAQRIALALPEDEGLPSTSEHLSALLLRFIPTPPELSALRAAGADPARADAVWPTAEKALAPGPYGTPESPIAALRDAIDEIEWGSGPDLDLDEVLGKLDTWQGAGKDGLVAAWEVCDDGAAMCAVLTAVGRLDDTLASACKGLSLEGHFRTPERYEHLHALAGAIYLRLFGPPAPTTSELRAALERMIAAAESE